LGILLQDVTSKLPAANENGRGSHGERIGDSGRREPWVFLAIKNPRLPGKSGQRGCQNRIFILKNAFETPFLAEKPRQS
jgi:hypothetical protein